MKKAISLILSLILSLSAFSFTEKESISKTSRPWTYWWWMGNSVTKDGLTYNLENMAKAGYGGVHIVPIYGERGDEENFVDYLSPEWMELLSHTVKEADRLGMGVDMTTGTGWPFGGPLVDSTYSAKRVSIEKINIKERTLDNLKDIVSAENVKGYTLYDKKGGPLYSSSTYSLPANKIIQNAECAVLVIQKPTNQRVKRSAPGGEGLVVDYFSSSAISRYMERFEKAFQSTTFPKGKVRAFYNDSYEVYGANYTPNFLVEFQAKRGYDLLPYINLLIDTVESDQKGRVLGDYCETVGDLLYEEFTKTWVNKGNEMGMLTRNQAHGSPGNLLDLYGLADIPETESFGSSGLNITGLEHDPDYPEATFGRPHPLTMKFASSAAHTKSKKLTSSESATWLADHFKVTLAQVKPQIDEMFVSGINHVFYHGVTYSPPRREFPGRLFYASSNFGPFSHFWDELPLLNSYITESQTILQNSQADNDILLYFAIHDVWSDLRKREIIRPFGVHKSNEWLKTKATGKLAYDLWDKGFAFDYISDKGLSNDVSTDNSSIVCGEGNYKAIVIPATVLIPVETLKRLLSLAEQGIMIYFEKDIPEDVPGLFEVEKRRKELKEIKTSLLSLENVKVGSDISQMLSQNGLARETMADQGLSYIRKQQNGETLYFISNLSNQFQEGWVELAKQSKKLDIYDVQNNKRGRATIKDGKIFLQLKSGESCFVMASTTKDDYPYLSLEPSEEIDLSSNWDLIPLRGAPVLPKSVHLSNLESWTNQGGDFQHFGGVVKYKKTFDLTKEQLKLDGFMLDISQLKETATIRINGKEVGTIWSLPYQMRIPIEYLKEDNTIELDVTNVSYNRVIDLDKRGVKWKNFYEINFISIQIRSFDASKEEPLPSGIIGEVKLIPYSTINGK